ncbi:Rho GTPase [Rhodosporidiobolus nylandii]
MPPLCGLPSLVGGASNDRDGLGRSWSRTAGGAAGRDARPIVVVGDGACGKTSLLNVFVNGHFPMDYEPTVFENHCTELLIDDRRVELSLWDTAGQEDFDRLRSLSYADTNVVLLCYSVEQPVSLENVEAKWIDEIMEHCPGVKICLVALKCDLREDQAARERLARHGVAPVEYEQGLLIAKRIRASRYLECSAKHDRGVREQRAWQCQRLEQGRRAGVSGRRNEAAQAAG